MRSAGFNSVTIVYAACRSFRATRCRSTAPPTDLATMKPICGAASTAAIARYPCTTRSGCEARTPCLTVWLKSADRVIRYRAGSTGARPVGQAVRERRPLRRRSATMARPARVRIRNRKPWTLARRRLFGWKVRLPLATAISSSYGSHGPNWPVHPGIRTAAFKALFEPARSRTSGRSRVADVWATIRGY